MPKKLTKHDKLQKESQKLVHKRDKKWQASVKEIKTYEKWEKKATTLWKEKQTCLKYRKACQKESQNKTN